MDNPSHPQPITERVNENTRNLDRMTALEIVTVMNQEDHLVPAAIQPVLPAVARTVDHMVDTLKQGGRIFYIGAGTSGRLGVLDASECPPTFSTDPEWVQGIIAGGDWALRHAVEGAEDSPEQGARDLMARDFCSRDLCIGLAASGRTPYVQGAISHAKKIGALTAVITCNPGSPLGRLADIPIEVNVGPEVLVGSTRLKAGTAQKLILNMLSTAAMVRMGKVYENLMVDLHPSNQKLKQRARRIVQSVTGACKDEVEQALIKCGGETKTAILMLMAGLDPEEARYRLNEADGMIQKALENVLNK
ncbi:N-acetylmuramic acid 6-phosphate etherase 1 [Marinithermofilum abyssi]|uniref:N-acetylmuramic acid 6-phosphate etherase n=1 Tax=Marinithermofilum abyssi TaxID=1571185 RepID=A0A8J2YCA2_9BACL|nr:N-acetylmuramic acid 6-phosphate etherase [Marinithermofilum abyssi]GGE05761.1 N-acetylmuramic acid 6-phosphate etherase 1 [Marinithermofilum abyssi]